ncbi:MAG: ComEC/Rec2 family competence protein [Candidatus Pacebacteria bacterium]|nr:ComEC/Rec2 family competence protein [Candidatus Paceibacterota bacterium]
MRGVYFYGFAVALAAGVAVALLERVTLAHSAFLLIICVALGAWVGFKNSFRECGGVLCGLIVIFAGFGIGALRGAHAVQVISFVDERNGENVTIEGVIVDEPIVTEKNQKIVIAQTGNENRMIMFAPVHPEFAYGDVIRASGTVKKPESFAIEGTDRTFNYPRYLAKQRVSAIIDKPNIELVSKGSGNLVMEWFITLRRTFVRGLEASVGEPYAGFASGVVLGVDGALSKHDEELFRNAGLIHVVVVSGYNITLVGDIIGRALSMFAPLIASAGSLIGICAFILLTGASQTAIRAGIMASLVVAARLTKRHYDMNRALTFAACLMILHQPLILLYDPSFQLSFLATWGLCNVTPITTHMLRWMPERFGLREIAATTLATQVAVTPLLLFMSGTVSIFSLPANIIVLPTMPLLMFASLTIGMLGLLPTLLLTPLSFIVEAVSAYVFFIVNLIDRTNHGTITFDSFSVVFLGGAYIFLGVLVLVSKRKTSQAFEPGGLEVRESGL